MILPVSVINTLVLSLILTCGKVCGIVIIIGVTFRPRILSLFSDRFGASAVMQVIAFVSATHGNVSVNVSVRDFGSMYHFASNVKGFVSVCESSPMC